MAGDLQHLVVLLRDIEAKLEVTPDRISDLSNVDFSDLRSIDLVMFAEKRRAATLKNKVKSAIIAPKSSVQYGLARMFKAHNQNPDIEIRIFNDLMSANEWLGRETKSVN
jgi:hypothetical protein